MSGSRAILGLVGVLLYLGGWGVWAILLDHHPEYSDNMLFDAINLWSSFVVKERSLFATFTVPNYHPPLCFLPAALLFVVTGPSLTVLRLTVFAQYLLSVWLAERVGHRVAGNAAGLVCAVLVGTFPLIVGWGRMGYMDMGVTLMVLWALGVVLDCTFESHLGGIKLGVVVGLGMLSKLAFPLFVIGPLLWVVGWKLRSRRHWMVFGTAVLAAVVVCGWWYLLQWHSILVNLQMSSAASPDGAAGVATSLRELTALVDGGVWLLALACLATVIAWRWKTVETARLALLSMTIWPGFLLLLFFHPLRRYALPVYALAGIITGIGLQTALERFGGRLGRVATAGLALFLLAHFTWLNLGSPSDRPPRQVTARSGFRLNDQGMLFPDRRDFSHYPRALRSMERRSRTCLVVYAGPGHHERHSSHDQRLRLEQPREVELVYQVDQLPRRSATLCVLLVTDGSEKNQWTVAPQSERAFYRSCLAYGWFEHLQSKKLVGAFGPSPLGLRYLHYQVGGVTHGSRNPRPPYCRLAFNVGDTI